MLEHNESSGNPAQWATHQFTWVGYIGVFKDTCSWVVYCVDLEDF